ncbi:hypothetical protein LXM94_25005 [Rhizobium sp. TRM95111]|uniref:hypothetical protein n=1 Tax=Rhizobium alarense TaxID=2846851 RepID=UPI001F2CC3A3|nr:hypothetical protein [Rhizobium alarense]MCF3643221.1 hypothetical protein [Rhizobium alarense]
MDFIDDLIVKTGKAVFHGVFAVVTGFVRLQFVVGALLVMSVGVFGVFSLARAIASLFGA